MNFDEHINYYLRVRNGMLLHRTLPVLVYGDLLPNGELQYSYVMWDGIVTRSYSTLGIACAVAADRTRQKLHELEKLGFTQELERAHKFHQLNQTLAQDEQKYAKWSNPIYIDKCIQRMHARIEKRIDQAVVRVQQFVASST